MLTYARRILGRFRRRRPARGEQLVDTAQHGHHAEARPQRDEHARLALQRFHGRRGTVELVDQGEILDGAALGGRAEPPQRRRAHLALAERLLGVWLRRSLAALGTSAGRGQRILRWLGGLLGGHLGPLKRRGGRDGRGGRRRQRPLVLLALGGRHWLRRLLNLRRLRLGAGGRRWLGRGPRRRLGRLLELGGLHGATHRGLVQGGGLRARGRRPRRCAIGGVAKLLQQHPLDVLTPIHRRRAEAVDVHVSGSLGEEVLHAELERGPHGGAVPARHLGARLGGRHVARTQPRARLGRGLVEAALQVQPQSRKPEAVAEALE